MPKKSFKLNLFLESSRLEIPKTKEESKSMLDSFGIFGSSNNGNTYYPGIDVQNDVIPKDEDYIRVPFRMLSSTIVAAGTWRSTDFGAKSGVLQQSASKLVGKPLYVNHDTDDIRNVIGTVESTKFSQGFTDKEGNKIPSGIDGIIKIDAKAHPTIARNVLTGAVGSTSVTVVFNYEPSHEMESDHAFEDQVGKVIDDRMVTREVTDIVDYHELSLVWLGADPFAKKLDEEGNPIFVDHGSVFESTFNKELYASSKEFYAKSCFSRKENLHLSRKIFNFSSREPSNMKKKIITLAALCEVFEMSSLEDAKIEGLTIMAKDDFTKLNTKAEGFDAEVEKVTALELGKTTLEGDLADSRSEVADLTSEKGAWATEKVELEKAAGLSTELLKAKQEEAKKLYNLSAGAEAKDSMKSLIEKASSEELDTMIEEYGGKVGNSFSGVCNTCESTDVTLRSSVAPKDAEDKDTENTTAKGLSELYGKSSFSLG